MKTIIMKKTLLSIIAIATIGFASTAQIVNIPDANFKAYLVGNDLIDTNFDDEIQVTEANAYVGGIYCESLSISDLTGIEAFTSLTELYCGFNSLSSLDISNNAALIELFCGTNNLSSLDLSNNTALTYLRLDINNLIVLDVSNNVNITYLRFNGNAINDIDLSNNFALTDMICYGASLTTLDLHNNVALTYLAAAGNDLNVLNIANGNNSSITTFSVTSNPNLTCVDVDDVAYSTSNWTNVDAGVSFSLNCQVDLVTSISIQGQGGNSSITTQGGTLQMIANVLPTYADDDSYTWSVTNGTGSASIDANGLLTAISDGTVTVTATANDASGTTGSAVITISNQSSAGIKEQVASIGLKMYPNPANNQITVEANEVIESIVFVNLMGETVKTIIAPTSTVDVSDLAKGVYMLQIQLEYVLVNQRLIKE
jgi:hypothetical protein